MFGVPFPEMVLLALLMTLGVDDRAGCIGRLVEVKTMESNGDMSLMVLISCVIWMLYSELPLLSFTGSLAVLLGLAKMSSL